MGFKEIIEGKKEWNAHVARVKKLPEDYQFVYKEIQKYMWKVGPVELNEGIGLFVNIVELFEEGASLGKGVLEVTGKDVALFCDNLIEGSCLYSDQFDIDVQEAVSKAMKKTIK